MICLAESSGCRRAVAFLTLLRKFSLWSPRRVNSSRKLKHLRFWSGQFTCAVAVCWEKSCLVIWSWNFCGIAVSAVHLISCSGEFGCGLFAIVQCSSLSTHWRFNTAVQSQLESRAANLLKCNRSWRIVVLPNEGTPQFKKKPTL